MLVPSDAALDAGLQASDAAGLPLHNVSPNQGKLLMLLALIHRVHTILEMLLANPLPHKFQDLLKHSSDRLSHLQDQVRQDSLTVIDCCESEEELGFLFPEIIRIHNHDLAVLDCWQNHIDWMRSLPPEDSKLLVDSKVTVIPNTKDTTTVVAPPEQLLYENLKQKSHYLSLQDQLLFMMEPDLRRESEFYISQQATVAGHKILVPSNLQQASDLTVANLYWYFKVRDKLEESEQNTAPVS